MRFRRALAVLMFVSPLSSPVSRAFAAEEALTAGRLISESLGARASGLAEAGTALTGDLTALSFNPAALPLMKRNEALARFQMSPGDVTGGTLAYGGRKGRAGWGVGASFLDAGKFEAVFTGGERFTRRAQQDVAAQAALGVVLWEAVALGVGGRFIHSTLLDEYHAAAFAGDAGILVQMPVPGWKVGASLRSMGGELKYRNVADPLPGEARVGTSFSYSPGGGRRPEDVPMEDWHMRDVEETPIFTVLVDGIRDSEGAISGAAGLEWTQWPKAAFRAGYGWGENSTGLTFGFGVNLIKYSLDYSWRFVDELSDAHRISFSIYWE